MKTILWLLLPISLAAAEVVDRIAAVVEDQVITRSEVQERKKQGVENPLDSLIRERLLQKEIDRIEIQVTDEDLARTVGEVLARNKITLDQLKAELEKEGNSFETYKRRLGEEIRKMKFMGHVIVPRIKITEEEILKKMGPNPTEEQRLLTRQRLIESKLSQELENYLDEVRQKTYVEIKK